MKKNIHIILIAVPLLIFAGCSSAPKRPPEVFINRNAATGQLDLGNQAVSKGDFPSAHLFFAEAWRLALGTDDPDTRIRVLIAEGNAWFNQGKRETADESWAQAQKEAEEGGITALVSVSKIYRARGTLAEGISDDIIPAAERAKRAQDVKKLTLAEMGNIKANQMYTAFAWKVVGLAEKEAGNWAEAEESIKKAAAIHEKGRYLEETAYDWYLIASIRSKAGQYSAAITALKTAIAFDRRAENANGLGMNWMAIGTIEEKAGNKDKAAAAYRRSAAIFNSVFLTANAAEAERRLAELK